MQSYLKSTHRDACEGSIPQNFVSYISHMSEFDTIHVKYTGVSRL